MLNERELKHINRLNKEKFYNYYLDVNEKHKAYEKITKRQMIEAIYNDISKGKHYLNRSVLKEDIMFLINHIKNNQIIIKRDNKNKSIIYRLYGSFLVFNYHYFGDEYEIPTKVIELFTNYDLNLLDEELDKFYYFLNGLLLVRGKIDVKDAKRIYESDKTNKINFNFNEGIKYMFGTVLNLSKDIYETFGLLVKENNFLDYYINNSYKETIYTTEEYLNYGKYGFNINKSTNHLYKIISKTIEADNIGYFIENFMIHLNENPASLDKYTFNTFLKASNGDLKKAMTLYNELIQNLPRWDFKGALQKDIKREDIIKFYERINALTNDSSDTCSCGSGLEHYVCCGNHDLLLKNKAVLRQSKVETFYNIINTLILYANLKYGKTKFRDYESFFSELKQQDYIELKRLALEDKAILNDFISDHKDMFEENEYEIIEGIKNSYEKHFYALKYVDNKLLIYNEENQVKIMLSGIISPLSEILPSNKFPTIIEVRLIPLKDLITYDIAFNSVGVQLGPNIEKKILEDSKDVKVITNFKEFKKYITK